MTIQVQGKVGKFLLLGAIGAGVGASAIQVVYELAKQRPEAVIAALSYWGPLFPIAAGLLFVVDRRFGQYADISRESAKAQQQMADAIQAIAQKDDRQTERMAREISVRRKPHGEVAARIRRCARCNDGRAKGAGA
jgi:hypothetical protein